MSVRPNLLRCYSTSPSPPSSTLAAAPPALSASRFPAAFTTIDTIVLPNVHARQAIGRYCPTATRSSA